MLRNFSLVVTLACTAPAFADAPAVVADIAPIHALVAKVMGDIGTPTLLIEQTAVPHSYALRPSQAVSLEQADLVFVTSEKLTPWLHDPLETLAGDANVVELMMIADTLHFDYREGGDAHDHDHDHGGDDAEELLDPHGWLDPANATLWVQHIADQLSEADAENASQYQANATAAAREINQLAEMITKQMAPFEEAHYMVLHDGFQYFDRRFGPHFAGSVALGDASAPSPARIAHAREEIEEHGVVCIFTEPQQSDRLVKVVIEGSETRTGEIDAIGARLSPGPDLYVQLLQSLADSFTNCLKG